MNPFEKFSKKFGFTRTETNVIIFILFACLIGLAVNIFKSVKNDKSYLEFNYKQEDSLFNAASGDPGIEDSTVNNEGKKIDSKHELSDFTKEKPLKTKANISSSLPKIIKINSASVSDLAVLPGIGQKTAERIAEYRDKHGRFKKPDDLLNIKGIGKTKLNRIKDSISFE